MTTICSRCRKDITQDEKENEKFVRCGYCKVYNTPKGSHSNKLKGGKGNMVAAKTKAKKTSSNLLKCSLCKRMVQKNTRKPDQWKGKEDKFKCRSCNKK